MLSTRADKSGNEALSLSLTQWVFKEKGVLRVGAVKHNKVGEINPPPAYTVFDMVVCVLSSTVFDNFMWPSLNFLLHYNMI